ncbi:hypothetical protein [Nannocystis sp.]|uniref:hypothetical protein n=1 Tax=Nannocystis sp. TaxID=1962667 RepID=UPI0025D3940E|nr:hypothetical protein [Nannocystis sp.]
MEALMVASPSVVDGGGFHCDDAFFEAIDPDDRASAIGTGGPVNLFVGRPDLRELAEAEALRPRLRRWVPTLVDATLPGGQPVLVPADWEKIGTPE